MAPPQGGLTWQDYWGIAKRVAREIQGDDREDVEQEIFLALWQARPADNALAWTIARRARGHYYRYMNYRRHEELAEDMASTQIEDRVLDRVILQGIPATILQIGFKRLAGFTLTNREHQRLYVFRHRPA